MEHLARKPNYIFLKPHTHISKDCCVKEQGSLLLKTTPASVLLAKCQIHLL